MPADPRARFSGTVDAYDKHRPSYPAALIDWVLATSGVSAGAKAADVGCGTGISTRLLDERGLDVIGVDANPDMLARARMHGGPVYQQAESHRTGLPSGAFDLVTVAQAFHWFDVEPTLAEFARILKPGAWVAAFWNHRTDATPFMREYEALLNSRCPEYPRSRDEVGVIGSIEASARVKDFTKAEFPNSQVMDREGFLGRCYSCSYVVNGVPDPDALRQAFDELFDKHAGNGTIEFLYRTKGFCWRLR
ncbi:MAG: class I SAM-dependent methyltransferase [Elusimicrobia bacterium]|nr:class I SAM-dependent methyltransferase [Elusimicrobiota bacterium]